MRLPKSLKNVFGRGNKKVKEESLHIGFIALSKCGRDEGKYSIILFAGEDKNYVYIGNGGGRNVQHPKKKKLKHLAITDYRLPEEYIVDGRVEITNAKARAVIKEYADSISDSDGE